MITLRSVLGRIEEACICLTITRQRFRTLADVIGKVAGDMQEARIANASEKSLDVDAERTTVIGDDEHNPDYQVK